MWIPKEFKLKSTTMDFSSSGQNSVEVNSLYADKIKIANAIEFVEWNENPIQLFVCDHCGYTQCSPGNWLALREVGDYKIFIPDFNMMDEGDWELSEYTPPYFTKTNGSILFSKESFSKLERTLSEIDLISPQKLSSYEVSRLLQWEAPCRVLGCYPEPVAFNRKIFLTTSSEDDDSLLSSYNDLLERMYSGKTELNIIPISENDELISIFMETREFIDWKPLVIIDGKIHLLITSNLAVVGVV